MGAFIDMCITINFYFIFIFLKSFTVLAVYKTLCRVFYITEVNPKQLPRIEMYALKPLSSKKIRLAGQVSVQER